VLAVKLASVAVFESMVAEEVEVGRKTASIVSFVVIGRFNPLRVRKLVTRSVLVARRLLLEIIAEDKEMLLESLVPLGLDESESLDTAEPLLRR
jgi:hypothetical protein